MSWRVARSLEVLLAEVNAAAPRRSKASDGSIGDVAHQKAGTSDHLPNPAGVVRARDFTNDPSGGLDSSDLAERIRLLAIKGHPALGSGAYVISDGRIASATYGWAWRPYSGANPHDHHCHVSVATLASGYDSMAPWGVLAKPAPSKPKPTPLQNAKAGLRKVIKATPKGKLRDRLRRFNQRLGK
jgi:hypothetical protein